MIHAALPQASLDELDRVIDILLGRPLSRSVPKSGIVELAGVQSGPLGDLAKTLMAHAGVSTVKALADFIGVLPQRAGSLRRGDLLAGSPAILKMIAVCERENIPWEQIAERPSEIRNRLPNQDSESPAGPPETPDQNIHVDVGLEELEALVTRRAAALGQGVSVVLASHGAKDFVGLSDQQKTKLAAWAVAPLDACQQYQEG